MARATYEQAFEDHQYLWAIGAAYDMTGGYVDSQDLDKLLANPTKTTARKCLISQIEYWFQAGTEDGGHAEMQAAYDNDPEVAKIADRYACDVTGR